ncbi:MAG: STAS domain-containing protein [Phycisphaerales bacterium]|nr:MAG: STAS domain-containing protein [Phycisphaerales bacterium]
MAEDAPHLSVSEFNGVKVVEFADRKILEELSIDEIGEELGKLVDDAGDVKVLLDFRNVEHLSSAALGMLIKLNKKIGDRGGKLKLSEITPQIYEVFKITRLNKLFEIYDTAGEAMTSF